MFIKYFVENIFDSKYLFFFPSKNVHVLATFKIVLLFWCKWDVLKYIDTANQMKRYKFKNILVDCQKHLCFVDTRFLQDLQDLISNLMGRYNNKNSDWTTIKYHHIIKSIELERVSRSCAATNEI